MKKQIKHLSKSTVSVLLALLMVVSTLTVGIVATNAAFVDSGSVGYNLWGIISEGTSWADHPIYASNAQGTSSANTIHLNPGEQFKFYRDDGKYAGPTNNQNTVYTPSNEGESWIDAGSSANWSLTDGWESGNFTITTWIKYNNNNNVGFYLARSTTDSWYLSGVINGSQIGKTNNSYKFTKGSNAYTYTKTFTATGVDQYFTVNNGDLVYQCGTSDGASGAAADPCYWGKNNWAYDNSKKWKIPASSAPNGSTVTVTWNNKTRKISWSIDTSAAGYYIHDASTNSGIVSAPGTQMTKVSNSEYTCELSANTDHFVNINTSPSASNAQSSTKAKKTSSSITMDAGSGATSVNTEYNITKNYNSGSTEYKMVYVKASKKIKVSFNPNSGLVTFSLDDIPFDGYYIGGRFATATAEANINANTTGATVGGNPDGYGVDKKTGSGYWSWDLWSTNIKFASAGSHLYELHTYRTIAQLSETKANTGHDPFYFVVHDQTAALVSGGSTGNSLGNNFQNYYGPTNSGTVLTLSPISVNAVQSQEMVFNNRDSQSDGRVVIHLDDTDYNTTTHTGTMKIWYTLESETPAAGDAVKITATPSSLTVGKARTVTAELTNIDTSKFAPGTLTYTFTIKNAGGDTVETKTITTDSDVASFKTTANNVDAGTYTYSVVVSGKQTDGTTDLRELSASTTAQYKTAGVYVTTNNLNGFVDGTTNPGWAQITGNTYTMNQTVTAGNTFTLTLSSEEGFVQGFEEYDYSNPDNRYYDITKSYITATTVDGEEETIATYVVKARSGCTISSITVDKVNKTIRVAASYANQTTNTTSSAKTITYYFAEHANEMGTSNPSGTVSNNIGMRIAYWNNSTGTASSNTTMVNITDGVDVNGNRGTSYTTASNTTGKNHIYVNVTELNASLTTWNSTQPFKIYAVDLPVWATSFRFVKSDDSAIAAEPVNMTDKDDAWDHCIALNPNRVYVLYNYKGNLDHERYFVKGVVLDKTLWTSGRTASATRTINAPGTQKFKSNIIDYKNISGLQNQTNGVNSGAKTAYGTAITHPLYFGYITDSDSTKWGSNFKLWDNVANSYNSDHRSYFASVWDLSGITTSTLATNSDKRSLKNKNGYGLLMTSDSNYVHPLFDFRSTDNGASENGWLYKNTDIASYVKEGVDFEFYKSEYNGITTYSYDSLTDYNRKYSTTDNAYYSATSTEGKKYAYGTDSDNAHYYGLFPFGGNTDKYSNTGFGIEFDIDFYMSNSGYLTNAQNQREDIVFNFSGDDDVWVYVDGVRVLDLGGAHKISAGSINFSEGKVYYKTTAKSTSSLSSSTDSYSVTASNMKVVDLNALMEAYGKKFDKTDAKTKHSFQMFYMERGAFQSNMSISFNLPQATGLNINNEVKSSYVNPALAAAAMESSNSDYFSYSIQDKLAGTAEFNTIKAQYPNAIAYNSSSVGTEYTSPLYPVFTGMKRQVGSSIYVLTAASGSGQSGSTAFSAGSSFAPLASNVFKIHDNNLQETAAADTTITGKTDTSGVFHLLGNQGAQFDSKVPANTLVEVKQSVNLGEVQENGSNPITYKTVPNNPTGNYYLTSYTIVDDSNNEVIGSGSEAVNYSSDILAADKRSSSNGFYYSNYSGKADDQRARMTVTFTNEIAVGNIRIEKKLDDDTHPDKTFYFTVKFAQIFGDTSDTTLKEYPQLTYKVYNISDNSEVYESALTYGTKGVRLKPGQYALIEGVPVESRFEVAEKATGGYSTAKIAKYAYKGGYSIGNKGAVTGDFVENPDNTNFTEYTAQTYPLPSYFYSEVLEGKDKVSTSGRSKTVTETQGGVSSQYTFYTNMIPPIQETYNSTENEYESLADVKFTNQKESITVTFKYYNRAVQNGTPAHISTTPSTYSKNYTDLDKYTKYLDSEHSQFNYIDFKELIEEAAVNFYISNESNVSNVIDTYKMWTTQSDAETAMTSETNLSSGSAYGEENAKFHTSSVGAANSNVGKTYITKDANKDDATITYNTSFVHGEKWVNYLNESGQDLTELSKYNGDYFDPEKKDTEEYSAKFKGPGSYSKYENVKQIVVWLYNVPKAYNVKVYGYQGSGDTAPTSKTITSNGVSKTVYVASTQKGSTTAYYNQRLGNELQVSKYNVNDAAYLSAYGIKGYQNALDPSALTTATYTSGGKTYKFAYWAYDADGKEIASTDSNYFYRITNNTNLYAVYTTDDTTLDKGLTLFKNGEDSYFDESGVSWTRLNAVVSPYNLPVADENIYQMTNINIYLSAQVRANAAQYNDSYITDLFNLYRDQLKTLVAQYYNVNSFSLSNAYTNPSLTLTTRGYVFTMPGTPMAEELPNANLVSLTNKNRMQFTTTFKTSALSKNTNGAVCILQAAAMNYAGDWIVSDNCLIYKYDQYVPAAG